MPIGLYRGYLGYCRGQFAGCFGLQVVDGQSCIGPIGEAECDGLVGLVFVCFM